MGRPEARVGEPARYQKCYGAADADEGADSDDIRPGGGCHPAARDVPTGLAGAQGPVGAGNRGASGGTVPLGGGLRERLGGARRSWRTGQFCGQRVGPRGSPRGLTLCVGQVNRLPSKAVARRQPCGKRFWGRSTCQDLIEAAFLAVTGQPLEPDGEGNADQGFGLLHPAHPLGRFGVCNAEAGRTRRDVRRPGVRRTTRRHASSRRSPRRADRPGGAADRRASGYGPVPRPVGDVEGEPGGSAAPTRGSRVALRCGWATGRPATFVKFRPRLSQSTEDDGLAGAISTLGTVRVFAQQGSEEATLAVLTYARIADQGTQDWPCRNPAYRVFDACADFPELRENFVKLLRQSPGLDAVPGRQSAGRAGSDRAGRGRVRPGPRHGRRGAPGRSGRPGRRRERSTGAAAVSRRGGRLHRGGADSSDSGPGGSRSSPAGVARDARSVRTGACAERVRGRGPGRHDDAGQDLRTRPAGQDPAVRARAGVPRGRPPEGGPALGRRRVLAAEAQGCPGAIERPGRQTPRQARHVRHAQGGAGAAAARARPPLGQGRPEDAGAPAVSGQPAVARRRGGHAGSRTRPQSPRRPPRRTPGREGAHPRTPRRAPPEARRAGNGPLLRRAARRGEVITRGEHRQGARPPVRGRVVQRHVAGLRRARRSQPVRGGSAGADHAAVAERRGEESRVRTRRDRQDRGGCGRGAARRARPDAERSVPRPLPGRAVRPVGGVLRRHRERARPDSDGAAEPPRGDRGRRLRGRRQVGDRQADAGAGADPGPRADERPDRVRRRGAADDDPRPRARNGPARPRPCGLGVLQEGGAAAGDAGRPPPREGHRDGGDGRRGARRADRSRRTPDRRRAASGGDRARRPAAGGTAPGGDASWSCC